VITSIKYRPFSFFLLLFFTARVCFGQNLVPNPSFEIHDSCPNNISFIEGAIGWKQLIITPDFFHECATNSAASIPYNIAGYQQPFNINDSAYAGIGTNITNDTAHEVMGIFRPCWC
jgi:hypothetical protein